MYMEDDEATELTSNGVLHNHDDSEANEQTRNNTAPIIPLASSEVELFNQIASRYSLDTTHRRVALRISETNGDNARFFTTACYLALIHQDVVQLLDRLPSASTSMSQSKAWLPSKEVSDYVHAYSQNLLTNPDLEAYTATEDAQKHSLPHCFENMVLQHLRNQSAPWKARLLPFGFGVSNTPGPAKAVHDFIKKKIKHNRDNLRKLLLCQVLNNHKHPPEHPIPKLPDLIVQVVLASHSSRILTADEIKDKTTVYDKMRFAFLRMEAVNYYTHPTSNKNTSHWTSIDKRLCELRAQSKVYQSAFFGLVTEQDHRLFGSGDAMFIVLNQDPDCFALPDETQIQARIEELQAHSASNSAEPNDGTEDTDAMDTA